MSSASTPPSRREFLAKADASSFFVMSPRWLAAAPQGESPRAVAGGAQALGGSRRFPAFLDAARRRRKPALLLRVPGERDARAAFLVALDRVLDPKPADAFVDDAAEVLCDSVVACGSTEAIDSLVKGAAREDDALLLELAGRRIDGVAIPAERRADPGAIVDALKALAHGVDGSRLRTRAEAAAAAAPQEALASMARILSGDEIDAIPPAHIDAVLPMMLVRERSNDGAASTAIRRAVWIHSRLNFEEHEPGPALPYGLELLSWSDNGCGGRWRGRKLRSLSPCGVAAMPGKLVRRFVDLVAR